MRARIAAILLISVLTVPLFSTYMWLQHKKYSIKKEVKKQIISGIEKDKLELLTFTKKEAEENLNWKHDYEFEFQGEMYDIVEKKQVGDTLYYWCWWDHKETKLNRQLSGLINKIMGGNEDTRKKQKHLSHYLNSLFYDAPFSWNPHPTETITNSFAIYYNYYHFFAFPPTPPPPWIIA